MGSLGTRLPCGRKQLRCYSRVLVTVVFCAFALVGLFNVHNTPSKDDDDAIRRQGQRKLLWTRFDEAANDPQWEYETEQDDVQLTKSTQKTNRNLTATPTHGRPRINTTIAPTESPCQPSSINDFPPDLFSSTSRRRGAVLIHLAVSMYLFVALAILCDDYFVPSLQRMSDSLGLQDDVAGATLLAIGGSAPELFTSVIGVFITRGDIGIGTILGSAVFNVLFVIGLCGVVAGKVLDISWFPITRDAGSYGISVLVLTLILYDSKVTWAEALVLVLIYPAYIVLMYISPKLERVLYRYIGDTASMKRRFPVADIPLTTEVVRIKSVDRQADQTNGEYRSVTMEDEGTMLDDDDDDDDDSEMPSSDDNNHLVTTSPVWSIPESCCGKIQWLLLLPINLLFKFSIPATSSDCCRRSIIITFTLSIVWIGLLTYVLIWMVTIIGDTVYVPDAVMGLTLVAFGSSVPDTFGSIIVAKQGLGDMAVAHSFGSNVFDILLCLGLPWTVMTLIYDPDSVIEIKSSGLFFSCFVLFGLLLLTYALFYIRKFVLDKLLGYLLLLIYGVFLVCAVALEVIHLKPSC